MPSVLRVCSFSVYIITSASNPAQLNMCSVCYKKHIAEHPEDKPADQVPKEPSRTLTPTLHVTPSLSPAKTSPSPNVKSVFSVAPQTPTKVSPQPNDRTVSPSPNSESPFTHSVSPSSWAGVRCAKCRKKIVIPFECKCGKKFCTRHRFPEDHDCTFDHKHDDLSKKLEQQNPKLEAQKIADI